MNPLFKLYLDKVIEEGPSEAIYVQDSLSDFLDDKGVLITGAQALEYGRGNLHDIPGVPVRYFCNIVHHSSHEEIKEYIRYLAKVC